MLAKVAIRVASGFDLPVSEFLNGAKSYIGEELADRMLDDKAIERMLRGSTGSEEVTGKVKPLVGKAYMEHKQIMDDHKCEDKDRCVHFEERMQLVGDGCGGKVWVRKENMQPWKDAHCP